MSSINLPSKELLEARHDFPGPYTFKVIGTAADDFATRVLSQVRHELELDDDPPHSFRTTKDGRHVSVTLEPDCTSAVQVLAIYSRLMEMDGLVLLL